MFFNAHKCYIRSQTTWHRAMSALTEVMELSRHISFYIISERSILLPVPGNCIYLPKANYAGKEAHDNTCTCHVVS